MEYDPPLDRGICTALRILQGEGVETFESCEGGPDHAYPEPTVRFHGDQADGNGIVGLRSFYPVLKSAPPKSTATKSKKAKGKGKTKKPLVKKDKNQRIKPQPVETPAHKVVYKILADGALHSRASVLTAGKEAGVLPIAIHGIFKHAKDIETVGDQVRLKKGDQEEEKKISNAS